MDHLKLELKRWERAFEHKHGRQPNRNDIKRVPEIKSKYIQYSLLRSKPEVQSDKTHNTPNKTQPTELGPTPQIYGKVISIFDMKVSPVKPNSVISPATTAPQPLEPSNDIQTVKRRLDFSITPRTSPKKANYGPNSPLKFENVEIRIHRTPMKDNAATISLLGKSPGSPSPIIKRPLAKPFLQLAKEHEKIMEEMETWSEEEVIARKIKDVFQEDHDETEDEDDMQQELPKRVKRRHILRPAKKQTNQDPKIPDNLHNELARLKRQALGQYDDEQSKEVSTDAETKAEKSPIKKRGGRKKYNTVSNNFRRLKLPSAKRSNGRWRRR